MKYKNTIIGGLLLFIVLAFSFLTIGYISSKSVENKVSKFSGYIAPQGSALEGLQITFQPDDVTCFGLVSFDCEIDNISLTVPEANISIGSIQKMSIGSFTSKGFDTQNGSLSYMNIKQLDLSKDYPLVKDLSADKELLVKNIFPLDLSLHLNSFTDKNQENKATLEAVLENRMMMSKIKGEVLTLKGSNEIFLDKNLSVTKDSSEAVVSKVVPLDYKSILTNFQIDITDKNILETVHTLYSIYFDLTDKKYQKFFNISTLGLDSPNKATKQEMKDEIAEKLGFIIASNENNKNLRSYTKGILALFLETGNTISMKGINRNNYTVEEMQVSAELGYLNTDQFKYYDIKTTINETK